jgi:hypothetical protein
MRIGTRALRHNLSASISRDDAHLAFRAVKPVCYVTVPV